MFNIGSICFTEQLTFLKYVNEYYLFYSITIVTFVCLFGLVWILKQFTYFEKNRITRAGAIPTLPYGNFRDVIKGDNSLHVFLWRHYNKFKRKGCKVGGLFLFLKPVILLVHSSSMPKGIGESSIIILKRDVLSGFIEKYNYSIKGALANKLLRKNDSSITALKDVLLETVCLMFGFHQPQDILEDVNQLLREKYQASLRYYLSLCLPLLKKKFNITSDLRQLMQALMEERKKNDVQQNDLLQYFIDSFNSNEDLTNEVFNTFADTLTYSYSTVVFCLYELANNEEIQEEIVGEIRRFNKKNLNKLTCENLKELCYVDAVVKETLRKYPPIATIIAPKSTNSNSIHEGKNALIVQSVLGIHRDPQFYTKPEAFDPDRFMERTHYLIKNNSNFIPFGMGPKSELYVKLVSLQVTLVLVSIFSSLQVKETDGATNVLKYNPRRLYLSPCEENIHLTFNRIY